MAYLPFKERAARQAQLGEGEDADAASSEAPSGSLCLQPPSPSRALVSSVVEGMVFNTGICHVWFLGRPGIGDFWGPGGPGGRQNLFKRWGAKRPLFWCGFPGRRGRPDPKSLRFLVGPKIMH